MEDTSEIIERFRNVIENRHEYARSLKEKASKNLAGYMCTHVPEEILYAAGIVPVRIISSHTSQALSRSYLHETYCSFSHDCAYEGLQNNYDYLDLIVMGSSCIHMSEAFNVLVRFAGFQQRSFLMSFPHIMHTRHAGEFFVESIEEFKKFVEKLVKKSITDEDLEMAIRLYNHNRRLLKRLWYFLKRRNSPITGVDASTVTIASQLMDKQECNKLLEELIHKLEMNPSKVMPGIRLMIVGGSCDDLRIINLIEQLNYNTNLVFADLCTASRYFWFEVPEDSPNKLEALAEGYLASRIPCPAKDNVLGTGERKRFRSIMQFIEDYKPDGIVFTYQRFCSPQPHDIVALKPILAKLGIPWTELELDTTFSLTQFRSQLESLIETIIGVTPFE